MGDVSLLKSQHSLDSLEEYESPTLIAGMSGSSSVGGSKRLSDVHIPAPDYSVCIASSEHFEKSGLAAAQEAALHDSAVLEMGYHMTESEYAFMPEGVTPKPPSIGSVDDLKALRLVRLRNLKVGKVHRGKILSGTLCCKSVKTMAVMNVFEEDSSRDATRLMIANAVPRSATTAEAQRLYPESAHLLVRDPYLTRFPDGIVGVLVENPANIIFNYLPAELPSPVCEKVELPSQQSFDRVLGSEKVELPSQQSFDRVLESVGQETTGQAVGGRSPVSLDKPVIEHHELSFLAESHRDDDSETSTLPPSIEDAPNLRDALIRHHCPSNSSPEIDSQSSSLSRTQESGALCTERFLQVGDVEKVAEECGFEVVRNGVRFGSSGVQVEIDPVEVKDVSPMAENEEICIGGENLLPGSLDFPRKDGEGDQATTANRGADTSDGSVECIKSVVEESVEMSAVAEGISAKGMPDSSGDCPKANGGHGTERGQSPTSETPVVKGVISVDTKTKRETADSAADHYDLDLTAASLRLMGNKYFARHDWARAIELYTKAILKAVQESKENSSPNCEKSVDQPFIEEPESEVVMDYSNRAEAWLRLHHYERAWADAERALSLDPNHLKSLFRKGRALLGVGDYQQALAHLETAYARAPFDKDLLAAIQMSRIGDHQSRLGIYDLTDYYLRGRFAREVPSCADYVGPVQVKAASGDKGLGLFLTRAVQAGDLCLVSNPLAMLESKSGSKVRKNVLESPGKGGVRMDKEVEEKLVHAVRERAKVSNKNRQRLLALCHSNERPETIPSMDLFIPGRRAAPGETPELDDARLHSIISRNAIERNMVCITTENRHLLEYREVSEDTSDDRCFYGLWVLPSFINHSCIPNVSLVVMGRALFVYASKDLSAGEELLCSYYNVFQPLPLRRELASRCWGFSCRCARCLLETRFESSLKRLYALHARLEPNPTFVLHFSPFGYKAPAKDLAKELEIVETSKKLDNRERRWLQASFTQLYTVSRDFMGPHGNHPYLEAALHAMELVCPGSNSTLEVGLLAREATRKESSGKKSSQYKAANQQVLRICQCIYGKQRIPVLQSLVDGTPLELANNS